LQMDKAADTMTNLQVIWSRPVHLQTVIENQPSMLSYDGTDHSIKTLGDSDETRRNSSTKTR